MKKNGELLLLDARQTLTTFHGERSARPSLLCGYAMGQFYKDATIDDVCRHHTHVVSGSGEVARIAKPA